MRRLVAIVLLAACNEGSETDPGVRGETAWQLVPGVDDQVLVTLEPHRLTDLPSVWDPIVETKIVGPTIGVTSEGAEAVTFAAGATVALVGDGEAWVVQSERTVWKNNYSGPGSLADPTPFVSLSTIDRASLSLVSTVALSPPIETPIVAGGELFDVSTYRSDRAVVRLRNADGSATTLYDDAGRSEGTCANENGLVFIHSGGVVNVRRDMNGAWTTHEVPIWGLQAGRIQCDLELERIASVFNGDVTVYDLATGDVVLRALGTKAPFALRGDGSAVVSWEPLEHTLMYTDASGTRSLELHADESADQPLVVGDLALFDTTSGEALIRLTDGVVVSRPPGGAAFGQKKAWRDGFVYARPGYKDDDLAPQLAGLVVVEAAGVTELPLPRVVRRPTLALLDGTRLYVRAEDDDDQPFLFVYDLATKELVDEIAQPQCNEKAMLQERGCR